MKDNVKEILDIIKKVSKAEVNSYNGFIETPPMKWEIFLDYITNLQEEVNKLTAESTEWESKCYDLQEENERLKEELERKGE